MYINKKQEIIDVLVIGAGASGAAFTWSIAEAGISTICLEQGPEINPKKCIVLAEEVFETSTLNKSVIEKQIKELENETSEESKNQYLIAKSKIEALNSSHYEKI